MPLNGLTERPSIYMNARNESVDSEPVPQTHRFFVQLKAYGLVDADERLVMRIASSTERIVAPADGPLALVIAILEEWQPVWRYSTLEAAEQDIQRLKSFVNKLRAE